MISIKKEVLERISNWDDETICVLTDFDRTITSFNSDSSWSILSKSYMVNEEYIKESQKLYEYYRPFEIDESLDYDIKCNLMNEWWTKHIELLIKYKLSLDVIKDASCNLEFMSFRDGAKEFLENMRVRNIPVIIISAGVGNFIEQFLINNNCNFDNIFIVSNFINFENGVAIGILGNIIHSLNKNNVSLSKHIDDIIRNRPNIVLLGDCVSDIRMAKEEARRNALKIGFLENNIFQNWHYFNENFDVVCTDNTSYNELFEKIRVLKK